MMDKINRLRIHNTCGLINSVPITQYCVDANIFGFGVNSSL
jgi:hypothetical protein